MMIMILIQLILIIYLQMSENTPENIESTHAPIQFVFIIIAIIFLIINIVFYDDRTLSLVLIIISLLISCTTVYYLRHMDKDYISMNEMRQQTATTTSPTSSTTFITSSMKSTFQQEKQLKNELINTNANRYATLQQNIV